MLTREELPKLAAAEAKKGTMTILSLNPAFHPAKSRGRLVSWELNPERSFMGQTVELVRSLDNVRIDGLALPSDPVAAILVLALVELATDRMADLIYSTSRQDISLGYIVVRTEEYFRTLSSSDIKSVSSGNRFFVINGTGQDMTEPQIGSLIRGLSVPSLSMVHAYIEPDEEHPTAGMAARMVGAGISIREIASGMVLYVPPENSLAAALQAVTIKGLGGAWPRVARINGDHVAEIADPETFPQLIPNHLLSEWQATSREVRVPPDLLERVIEALEMADGDQHVRELRACQ